MIHKNCNKKYKYICNIDWDHNYEKIGKGQNDGIGNYLLLEKMNLIKIHNRSAESLPQK